MNNGVSEGTVAEIKFVTGLRGYHVYRTNWKPHLKQPLTFKQERNNEHDRFAGQTNLPGTLSPSTVGHIPLELSRYIWYALERGASINAEVKSAKYKPSPLVQGGLEIPIEVTVRWADERGLQILKEKVDSVRYPVGDKESYIDDSKEILKSILNDVQLIESDSDSEQSEQSDCDSEQSNEQSDCDSAL
jgi:hypothetical protein